MVSYIMAQDDYAKLMSERGALGLGALLGDLGFDLTKAMKVDKKSDRIEFWQPEQDVLITPNMPVINGSQRKQRLNLNQKRIIAA